VAASAASRVVTSVMLSMSCWTSTVPEAVSCSTFCGAAVMTFWASAVPATARAAQAASNLIVFFKAKYSLFVLNERQRRRATPPPAVAPTPQRRWLRGAVSERAAVGGAGAMRSAGCDSAEFNRGSRSGRGPLAPHLLAQLEQLGGREPRPAMRLLAPHLFSLRGPVGGHRIADFAAAHLADPEEIAGTASVGPQAKTRMNGSAEKGSLIERKSLGSGTVPPLAKRRMTRTRASASFVT
jgi:hypothetical protein